MKAEFAILHAEYEVAQSKCDRAKGKLLEAIRNCHHKWGNVVYDPIRHEGYHINGDPPGVGGSDHQFPMDVPSETIKRWTRTCELCGKVQETKNVRQEVIEHPKFTD